MNPAAPDETFRITFETDGFILRDGTGKFWDSDEKSPKRLEKIAWSHGAMTLVHDYDLKRAEP